ncbi:hypothetical protein [Actinospica sp.]|jgi:hypothetical protein|uniref:hypothetical protein n=1 Tax=Actinospica sp. TaxID=1872142 RepID=UPI002CB5225C|nr:hypothetical protein [Actinospica sp.]HWG25588.1 hypothetical protein [Actinospica sp.]
MKIAVYDENAFSMDHPRGTVSFNYLLMGDRSKPLENYRYILGRNEADFSMPRHRHTFEQIRLPVVGDMNLGEQGILHEGEIGYFPEGQTYGPQDDKIGEPKQLQLVLQFAGASGLGMSAGRGRGPGNAEAQRDRREQRPTKFPRPRYQGVIKMHPDRYNWLPIPGVEGVERKFFGSFTDRAFWIDMVKIDAGASWTSSSADARRLTVVLSGTGTIEDTKIARLGAVEADPGEDAHYTATEQLLLYTIGIPPIQLPATPSDQFDEITTDGGIQFENPADARNG